MIGRLRGRQAFAELRRGGRTVRGPLLMIRYFESDHGVRVGYAMPRGIGGAVQRNRLRRQLRAVFETLSRDDAGRVRSGDYLVRAQSEAIGRPFSALREETGTLLDQLHAGGR